MPSRAHRSRSCPTICSNFTARKLKCWQRERMVWGISSGCVVASMNYVTRWLLQRLQQRIESRVSDLVGFVQDVDLEPVTGWPITRCFPQLANLIDSAIGCGINFDHVDRIPGPNLGTGITNSARFGDRLLG